MQSSAWVYQYNIAITQEYYCGTPWSSDKPYVAIELNAEGSQTDHSGSQAISEPSLPLSLAGRLAPPQDLKYE